MTYSPTLGAGTGAGAGGAGVGDLLPIGLLCQMHFVAMKNSRKRSGFVIYLYFKDGAFSAVEGATRV